MCNLSDLIAEDKLAQKDAEYKVIIEEKDTALAEKDTALAEKDAEIAALKAQLAAQSRSNKQE